MSRRHKVSRKMVTRLMDRFGKSLSQISAALIGLLLGFAVPVQAGTLSWLPSKASLVAALNRRTASEAGTPLHRMVADAAGFQQLLAATPETWKEEASGIILGGWRQGGQTRRVILLEGASFESAVVPPDFVAAAVSPRRLIFGPAAAVADCLSTRGGTVLLEELQDSILARSREPVVAWAWTNGDRLLEEPLDAPPPVWTLRHVRRHLRATTLVASVADGRIRVHMSARTESPGTAQFLAAELKEHLVAVTPGGDSPLQTLMDQAEIAADENRTALTLPLTAEVLPPLVGSENARRLFWWQLSGALRERRERVDEMAEMLQLGSGGRVADIGTGRGFLAVRLARLVGEDGKVWAVDINPDALEAIQARADADHHSQLETVHGKEDDPLLPDESLDAAVIVNAYHEMPKHREMLAAIRASLRPGGRLLLLEPYSLETQDQPRPQQIERHHIAPGLLEEELGEAGFEILRRIDDFVAPQDPGSPQRDGLVLAAKPREAAADH